MGSEVTRVNKFGIAKGTTWGTAVVTETNAGLYPIGFTGFNYDRNIHIDKGAGHGFESSAHRGNDSPFEFSWSSILYEDDWATLFLLAMMHGNNTVTGAGDPYTHTMIAQDESGYFFTFRGEESSEIKSTASAVLLSADLVFEEGEGVWKLDCTGRGLPPAVEGAVSSLTYKSLTNPFLKQNTVLRINDQSGDALDSDDAIGVSNLAIRMARPADAKHVTGSVNYAQFKGGEFPEWILEFTIPHKSADSIAMYADWAGTYNKADITLTGNTNRELLLQYPQVYIESVVNRHEEVLATDVRCRLQKAISAPTGMTGMTRPQADWQTDETTSPIA